MQIQLNDPNLTAYHIGTFKLKDKLGRRTIKVGFTKEQKEDFDHIVIEKVHGESNKIMIFIISRKRKSGVVMPQKIFTPERIVKP